MSPNPEKMDKYECSCQCENEECPQIHNPPRPPCSCIRQISKSTKFIQRLLDCTDTIVRVLRICSIHECKAKAASDVIIFAFLHFDIVPDPACDRLKKKLRKEDLFYDLGRKCRMNRTEAHLAYSLIKKAFKAFYYKQKPEMYNANFIDEAQWMRAAQRSAEVRAISEGLSENERKKLENRIIGVYQSYIERVKEARDKDEEIKCTCCFCSKCKTFGGDGYKIYASELPKEDKEEYEFKRRLIEEGKMHAQFPQDACGQDVLKWQTEAKESTRNSFCKPVEMSEGIAVEWADAPEFIQGFEVT